MNIAFVVNDYPSDLGGIARYTGDVVRFLSRAWPVDVHRLTDSNPQPWPPHPHAGCIDPREWHEHPERIVARFEASGIRHVLINHIDMAGPRITRAFRRARLPLSVFLYGADINLRRGLRGYARMYVTAAGMANRIVISQGTRRVFHRRLPGLTSRLLLPGIEEMPGAQPSCGPREGIVAVGRFVRRKGFDKLIDATELLARDGLRPRLTLIGDGPDRDWLHQRIRAAGIESHTRVLSGLNDDDVRAELRAHRVFCLLPRCLGNGDVEGFGIVFLEAAREGLPVVAGRSGGVPDAVNDQMNGFLVDPEHATDAARRLRLLLTDDGLWVRQSAESLQWFGKFAWSQRDPVREFQFLASKS